MYYTYILTNMHNAVFYIGVTNNLHRRIDEHTLGQENTFTKRYNMSKLVYAEQYKYVEDAIMREKQLKNWHREWKINLIKKTNERFVDISDTIVACYCLHSV